MAEQNIAVLCVGNFLMLDDGVGPIVADELNRAYEFPENVEIISCGAMTLDMLNLVGEYDLLISLDAADDPGAEPGTVFRYAPDDLAHRGTPMGSLHELRLADLIDAAMMLGLDADGLCFGIQAENADPSELVSGLTPKVAAGLPIMIDALLAELVNRGCKVTVKATGKLVEPGYHHTLQRDWNAPVDSLSLN